MGLCTGFSFLSGFEVFYHLFFGCFDGVRTKRDGVSADDDEERQGSGSGWRQAWGGRKRSGVEKVDSMESGLT